MSFHRNPNENLRQDSTLVVSREKSRFRSIVWDQYDPTHQKYLEIGMKPRMKNHFRAHQLSVWLRLIPELHRAGMEDVVARHNLFRNHNDADLYDGAVRPDPLSRVSYYDPTMELFRRRPNVSLQAETPTTADTIATTCVNIVSGTGSAGYNHPSLQNSSSDTLANLEAAGYAAYSTALSVTIAIGCSLLILNVLIFAGVYYQRDKTRLEVKSLQQQQQQGSGGGRGGQSGLNSGFETISKHGHYHPQSASIIVDVEQDGGTKHLCPGNTLLKAPPPSPNVVQNCMTLPKGSSVMSAAQGYAVCMKNASATLPRNANTLMNNAATVIAEMQQQGIVQPPNGTATMHLNVPRPPPPPRAKSPPESQPLLATKPPMPPNAGMRVPQAAMSEMRV